MQLVRIDGAVSSEPLVGDAQADPRLGSKAREGLAIPDASGQQSFPAEGC